MSISLGIVGLVLLVCCSAFFSASEMAYSSCNSIRLEKLKEEGSKRAGVALRIAEHFDLSNGRRISVAPMVKMPVFHRCGT